MFCPVPKIFPAALELAWNTNSAVVDTNTPVGLYPIHVITPQTAPNYAISYVDGTLTVTQAVLLVTADPKSRLYGATNPVLTVTYSGFLNADGTNVIGGQPDLSTPACGRQPRRQLRHRGGVGQLERGRHGGNHIGGIASHSIGHATAI